MLKLVPLLVPLLILLAVACDGAGSDDDVVATVLPETPEASPTGEGGASGTATATPEPEPGTTATQPPEGSETPEPETDDGETGETGETPADAPDGTPAVGPADISEYEGMSFDSGSCTFDPRSSLADCPGFGVYSVSPPLTGQDISCSLFVDNDEPVLVFCRSKEPMDARYYEIQ